MKNPTTTTVVAPTAHNHELRPVNGRPLRRAIFRPRKIPNGAISEAPRVVTPKSSRRMIANTPERMRSTGDERPTELEAAASPKSDITISLACGLGECTYAPGDVRIWAPHGLSNTTSQRPSF